MEEYTDQTTRESTSINWLRTLTPPVLAGLGTFAGSIALAALGCPPVLGAIVLMAVAVFAVAVLS